MSIPVRVTAVALACVCALFALWVRAENAIGVVRSVPGTEVETWGSYDPDTLYHARRVARGVEDHGWITSYDRLLNHPHGPESLGTPIPWPPTYDLLLTAIARGGIPDFEVLFTDRAGIEADVPLDATQRARIERLVSTVPMVCGTLAALIAALCAGGLARGLVREDVRPAAVLGASLFAGLTVAATFGHVRYSHLGNGDHHAFVSLLHLAMLGLVASSLRADKIVQPVRSVGRGALAGLIAGVLITSWTASILWVALVQLAMVVRLVVRFPSQDQEGARANARGLPLFATSFHKAAILVLVPAVIESPFTTTAPFGLVDLSWFHLVWMAAGWLVFAPYALVPRQATKRPLVMTLPALVVALLVAFATDAPARLGAAFSWAGATNVFMGSINESQPLIGDGGSLRDLVKFAGLLSILGPVAFAFALRATRRAPEMLPWVATLPVVLVMAALQRRFAEALTGPLAVVLGALAAAGAVALLRDRLRASGGVQVAVVLGLAGLALAAHPWTLRNTWSRMGIRTSTGERFVTVTPTALSQRYFAETLQGLGETDGRGLLAEWDLGHAVEWRAGWPTIATNFGLYLGEASFLTPWRFFAETDDERALKILEDRDVGYVLIDKRTEARRSTIASALGYEGLAGPLWGQTMGARLRGRGNGDPPSYLRLVRVGEDFNGDPIRVYERVRGARIRALAESITVAVSVESYAGSTTWRTRVRAEGDGPESLVVTVPYAPQAEPTRPTIDEPVGTVHVHSFEVFVDGESVIVDLPPRAVEEGALVDVER